MRGCLVSQSQLIIRSFPREMRFCGHNQEKRNAFLIHHLVGSGVMAGHYQYSVVMKFSGSWLWWNNVCPSVFEVMCSCGFTWWQLPPSLRELILEWFELLMAGWSGVLWPCFVVVVELSVQVNWHLSILGQLHGRSYINKLSTIFCFLPPSFLLISLNHSLFHPFVSSNFSCVPFKFWKTIITMAPHISTDLRDITFGHGSW